MGPRAACDEASGGETEPVRAQQERSQADLPLLEADPAVLPHLKGEADIIQFDPRHEPKFLAGLGRCERRAPL